RTRIPNSADFVDHVEVSLVPFLHFVVRLFLPPRASVVSRRLARTGRTRGFTIAGDACPSHWRWGCRGCGGHGRLPVHGSVGTGFWSDVCGWTRRIEADRLHVRRWPE